jgi:hypothetical protein
LPTIQKKIVWVHFGVNSGATNFAVEWRAVNEATFRCADELGWQPQHAPIITEDGPISHIREVPCLHSLNGIETSVGQFFDFVKDLQFRFFETFQNLRTSVSGTFSESKEPPVTYQMSHSRQA